MRAEKKYISAEYLERLKASPYFIVVDYNGLKVEEFNALRTKLREIDAEVHVVKNRIFGIAAGEAGIQDDVAGQMKGPRAVVTGPKEISSAAKVVKTFHKDSEKAGMVFGYLGNDRLDGADLERIADLPSLDVLRGQILGTLQSPASKLVQVLNAPGSQLAQVLKAKADKG